jgi:hypothetical protein
MISMAHQKESETRADTDSKEPRKIEVFTQTGRRLDFNAALLACKLTNCGDIKALGVAVLVSYYLRVHSVI